MAGGDLEARVEIGGRDEVADMAAALEVFRRHALEVQRLNLVERLAQELQGKNEQLEKAFEDLGRAQDQIVMREKLAALGELTAGVAHEIRNPLNFVKNFSEASEELIVELKEVLEEGGDKLDEEQRSLLAEITGDLVDNLGRIRSHGDRANRIVHDMLMMGRHSSEVLKVDINALLEEYARLAYHSARATDPEFQLDMQYDLDPHMGELEVIPQDLGRVFLNMVANACDATDEKRRAGAAHGEDGNPYVPTLRISSERTADGAAAAHHHVDSRPRHAADHRRAGGIGRHPGLAGGARRRAGVKENVYFQAAQAIGSSRRRSLLRHVLPNIAAPIIIIFSINVGGVIMSEAALSFLGFGLPPDIPSWGGMLSREGRQYMEMAPHLALWPGLCLTVVVYSLSTCSATRCATSWTPACAAGSGATAPAGISGGIIHHHRYHR